MAEAATYWREFLRVQEPFAVEETQEWPLLARTGFFEPLTPDT